MKAGAKDTAAAHDAADDFCRNLRHACGYYPSIAQVCRKLDINRPQFNKYLSGASRPSAHTLQRICDFFGVEVYEIWLPHARFAQLLSVRPAPAARAGRDQHGRDFGAQVEALQRQSRGGLDKYLGFYFEYYYSMAFPGLVLRSLFYLYRDGDAVCYRRIERLSRLGRRASGYRCRYLGVALHLNERIFLLDHETLTGNELSETILFPTYKSRVSHLAGLKIGVSASDRREPACARVVLEALGQHIDVRGALRLCGLLDPTDPTLDAEILRRIDNRQHGSDWHFLGFPF
ncbi:MAG: helix-turn-helix domain-containing protein [Rhodocyclaceae bacterium]